MDDHNLTVDDAVGHRMGQVDLPAAGQTYELVLDLAPGTYRLYCSLLDHAEKGMEAAVTVR